MTIVSFKTFLVQSKSIYFEQEFMKYRYQKINTFLTQVLKFVKAG